MSTASDYRKRQKEHSEKMAEVIARAPEAPKFVGEGWSAHISYLTSGLTVSRDRHDDGGGFYGGSAYARPQLGAYGNALASLAIPESDLPAFVAWLKDVYGL